MFTLIKAYTHILQVTITIITSCHLTQVLPSLDVADQPKDWCNTSTKVILLNISQNIRYPFQM